MFHLICTRRFGLMLAVWLVISAVLMGVSASCETSSGMHQGGSDSEPHWR